MGALPRRVSAQGRRVDRADAEAGLAALLAQRASGDEAPAHRERQATFDDVIDGWLAAGCPTAQADARRCHHRTKSPNTVDNARSLLRTHVQPALGSLRVDRTTPQRIEAVFSAMAADGYATSTIDRTWGYLNQACMWAVRQRRLVTNPAAELLLPERRPPEQRRSLSIEQVERLIRAAIPADPNPAMWLTGLMCGLRPGELAGLRWPFVDIDSDAPMPDALAPSVPLSASWRPVRPGFVTVLSIGKLRPGRADYYLDTVARGAEEYYTGSGEAPGRWVGRGAQARR